MCLHFLIFPSLHTASHEQEPTSNRSLVLSMWSMLHLPPPPDLLAKSIEPSAKKMPGHGSIALCKRALQGSFSLLVAGSVVRLRVSIKAPRDNPDRKRCHINKDALIWIWIRCKTPRASTPTVQYASGGSKALVKSCTILWGPTWMFHFKSCVKV